jgi:hypothetical protein
MQFLGSVKPGTADDLDPNVAPPPLARRLSLAPLGALADATRLCSLYLEVVNGAGVPCSDGVAEVDLYGLDEGSGYWLLLGGTSAPVPNYTLAQPTMPQAGTPTVLFPRITSISGTGAAAVRIWYQATTTGAP